jgi:plasmid stabilization system protein ParE
VIWTLPARVDLAEAIEYRAEQSPAAAVWFLEAVEQASATLAVLAERGRIVPELWGSGAREIFVQRFRLIYVIRDDEVRVRSFIHGARNWRP